MNQNLNVGNVTRALQQLLRDDLEIAARGVRSADIEIAEIVNESIDRTPWIGIYKGSVGYAPRTLGAHAASWQAAPQPRVIVQAGGLQGGAETEILLEDLIRDVMRVVFDSLTLNDTVDMVTGVNVEYRFIEADMESSYLQTAILTFSTEVATG